MSQPVKHAGPDTRPVDDRHRGHQGPTAGGHSPEIRDAAGGQAEVRDRQPGMMLLISMAITVAYVASMATSLDWLDLEFWWELAALVTIMLLGHWQEMKAIGQARGALAALDELLPDDAELIDGDDVRRVSIDELEVGDVVLVRAGGRVP